MRDSTLKVVVGDVTYYIDDPKPVDGLKASVSVVNETEPLARILHRDRINLDRAKDREAFAVAAGTKADDLLDVRDRVLDFLVPSPPPNAEPTPTIDPEVHAAALALLDDPHLLTRMRETITALGYAGDLTQPTLVFLVLVSRLLARPINLVVGGPSAAGKSFLVALVTRLFPPIATYALNGMSERVLVYTDADLRHRTLIVGEAAALHREGIGASLLRSIAWEGNVVYETVESTPEGLKPRRIEKPGPTGFVTTTTKSVEAELETRVLTISVPDDKEATRTILLATAERANGRCPDEPDLRSWHEMQRILAEDGVHDVSIPFAKELGKRYPAEHVRSRRDFSQLLALVQANALLHQRQRARDAAGRIIATDADYRTIYDIAAPLFGAIAAEGVTNEIRQTVATVGELTKDSEGATVSIAQLARALKLDKSSVSRRVRIAVRGDFLVNEEPGKGKPYRLRLGDPLPEERPALPTPEAVFDPSVQQCNTLPAWDENPPDDAENSVASASATGVQQGNGSASSVAGVAGVLHGPMQHLFPHGDAENEGESRGCALLHRGRGNRIASASARRKTRSSPCRPRRSRPARYAARPSTAVSNATTAIRTRPNGETEDG